jgi:hypothetical protein
MRKPITLTLAAAACLLAGCAQQWAKPGATEADLHIARSRCEAQAFSMFPRELVTHQPQRQAPQQFFIQNDSPTTIRTSCTGFGNTVDCVQQRETSRPLNFISSNPVPARPITMDFNEGPRRRAVDACLLENGWRPVDSKGNPVPLG